MHFQTATSTPKWLEIGPKLVPKWSKIGTDGSFWAKTCQDDPKMGQHEPPNQPKQSQDARKMAQLAPKLTQQGPTWSPGRILGPPGDPPEFTSAGVATGFAVEF